MKGSSVIFFIAVVSGLFCCGLLEAAVINADWKVSGDGLAIFDTTNNTEWLNLTETANLSMNYVSGQLGPSGEFEGWRFATVTEVQEMLISAGTVYFGWHVDNVAPVENLLNIWGELGTNSTYGFRESKFNYIPNGEVVAGAISIGNSSWMPGEGYSSDKGIYANPSSWADRANPDTANALIRVPEPTTLLLLGMGGVLIRKR